MIVQTRRILGNRREKFLTSLPVFGKRNEYIYESISSRPTIKNKTHITRVNIQRETDWISKSREKEREREREIVNAERGAVSQANPKRGL